MSKHTTYSVLEEKINIYSHLLGGVLSAVAFVLLLLKGLNDPKLLHLFSYCVFSLSMIFLYFSSANYHRTVDIKKRYRLKVVDHCAIYVLIAGSYTPFALITMIDQGGWLLFAISWSFAAVGITLKLFFTGRFKVISTLMYVAMGWLIIFFVKPLIQSFSADGIFWLVMGGLSYTAGAVIYLIKKIPFNHAIFHVFVLAGSISIFLSVYWYVG
ncbi:MAG: hemolysin D [Halobacteriovorax sp.]|nr:hemolysin D [Halobacteriovorax sp.]